MDSALSYVLFSGSDTKSASSVVVKGVSSAVVGGSDVGCDARSVAV